MQNKGRSLISEPLLLKGDFQLVIDLGRHVKIETSNALRMIKKKTVRQLLKVNQNLRRNSSGKKYQSNSPSETKFGSCGFAKFF